MTGDDQGFHPVKFSARVGTLEIFKNGPINKKAPLKSGAFLLIEKPNKQVNITASPKNGFRIKDVYQERSK